MRAWFHDLLIYTWFKCSIRKTRYYRKVKAITVHMYRVFLFIDLCSTSSQGSIFLNIDVRFVAICRYRNSFFYIYDTWRYIKNHGNASNSWKKVVSPTKSIYLKNSNPLWIAIESKVTNIESISRVETKQKSIRIILWGRIWWFDLYHGLYDSL